MSQIKITVLMALYNGEKYLQESLNSVLAQSFKDFEFLIIDDCSKDGSLSIIDSCHDPRIRIHHNNENIGQTKSLNVGLRLARGEYIARIDADDLVYPDWLCKQMEFITAHPEYAVVSAKAVAIDAKGRVIRLLNSPQAFGEIFLKSLTASPVNHVGSVMYKKTVVDLGGYDETYKIAADFALWSKMIARGHKIISTNDVLIGVRFHEESVSVVERGRIDREEISRIIFENINVLTEATIDRNSARLIWDLVYDVSALNMQKTVTALDILLNACDHIKNVYSLGDDAIDREKRRLQKVVGMKKILSAISQKDINEVRQCSRQNMKTLGSVSLFGLIWLSSFLGALVLKVWPVLFSLYTKLKLQVSLLGKPKNFCQSV